AGTETPSVTDDDGTTFDTATPTDEDGPGFGPVVALVALLASALLIYRRR
ncbi:copper-binding protein, partial [Halobacteriales archaeon SW_12_69_24]